MLKLPTIHTNLFNSVDDENIAFVSLKNYLKSPEMTKCYWKVPTCFNGLSDC